MMLEGDRISEFKLVPFDQQISRDDIPYKWKYCPWAASHAAEATQLSIGCNGGYLKPIRGVKVGIMGLKCSLAFGCVQKPKG